MAGIWRKTFLETDKILEKDNFQRKNTNMLAYFMPSLSFYTPSKYWKTRDFLMLLMVVEGDQWH